MLRSEFITDVCVKTDEASLFDLTFVALSQKLWQTFQNFTYDSHPFPSDDSA